MTERFTITLESIPHSIPVAARLKSLFKTLLRGWGFRVVEAREITLLAEMDAQQRDRRAIDHVDDTSPVGVT